MKRKMMDADNDTGLAEKLAAICRLGGELTMLRDEAAGIERTLQTVIGMLHPDAAACGLVDEAAGELEYHLLISAASEITRLRVPLDETRSLGAAVARSGQAANVPDVAQDARCGPLPGLTFSRSELCMPMRVGERILGVLHAQSAAAGRFTPDDQRILQTLADQAAVALENARLHADTQRRARELLVLNQASRALASTLDLNTVLEQTMVEVKALLGAQGASVLLHDPVHGELIFGAVAGPSSEKVAGTRLPVTSGIAGWVVREKQSILVDDAQRDRDFYAGVDRLTGLTTRSLVAVPLLYKRRVVGVIESVNKAQGTFDQHDVELLEALASSAAIAIENARLHAETEWRAEQSAILYDLDRAVTASLRRSDVYYAFSRHAARLLAYDRMSVALWEGDEMRITYVAGEVKTPPEAGTKLPLKTSAAGWVVTQGQPLLRHSLSADARFVEDEPLIAGGIHSEVAVPLRVKRRIIGTLSVSSRQVGAYEPDCLTTAQSMADQLAAAIENARLHEDLQARLDALHEAQARLVQSEKLAALGELVAGVAHELNNPLTSIFGYAQLMQFGAVSEETRKHLDRIVAQTRHATSIIRALLDFARQRPPERRPTQISNVLTSTLDLLGYELRHADVTWTTHFSPDIPVTMADPHQLQQVFVNVVNNARQVMRDAHQGGHLTITAEVGPSAFIKDQPEAAPVIRITFRDDGPGIPSDALPHIFDPFFTTKSGGGGTGLGLSICHGIISEHGGHIWAESQPGEGATFFIELPIVAAEST
jgi:two-component system NtrC family sensor kinase